MRKKIIDMVKDRNNKSLWLMGILFFMLIGLTYLFPYTGDDWTWGSYMGIDRLKVWFRNYNGRYAGNLLVLLLTRVKLIRVLVVTCSIVFLCYAAKLFTKSKHLTTVFFSIALFFLIPRHIFVQAIAWTAGFSNYVPPILLCILYMILVRNIFEDEAPEYTRFMPCWCFLIGFVGAMFMENLTLYSIAVGFLVVAFVWVRFRRFYVTHIAYFAGALVGALMMFTNGAYSNILNSTDTYRSTALDKGLLNTVASHCKVIAEQFFITNIPIFIVISILCIVLTILHMKDCKDYRRIHASWVAIFTNMLCLGIFYVKEGYTYWVLAVGNPNSDEYTLITMVLIAVMYCFSVLMTVLLCVTEKKTLYKLLFWLVSVPIIIAPLAVVNPIGPRCFFPPYAVLIMFCGTLLEYMQEKYEWKAGLQKGLSVSMAAVSVAVFFYLTSIYGTIHTYDVKREEYVNKQIEQGCEVITTCNLPYVPYVWSGEIKAPFADRYQIFNGIERGKEMNVLTYYQFDNWIKEFDKE